MAHARRVTRRAVLRGAAAGVAALSLGGCGGARRVTGRIVGPSDVRGHLVRAAAAPEGEGRDAGRRAAQHRAPRHPPGVRHFPPS